MTDLTASDFVSYGSLTLSEIQGIEAGPLALYSVAVDSIQPTQMNEGFSEVDAKAAGFNEFTTISQVESDILGDVEPVVIGPDGQLYLLDGHHTFTALIDSVWGASDPTVYVNVVANYSNLSESQFFATLQQSNLLLPLNDGIPQTVNDATGTPIPTSLTGLTNDPYRGLEYSILKNKSSKLFTTTNNITGAVGASIPGLDKMTGFYSDFLEAAAYRDANNGLGLSYLSPGDIALATQWNLNGNNLTSLPNIGAVYVYQLPGFILSQNITVGSVISNTTLANGALDGNGTFTGVTEINAGTVSNPIIIGTPNVGFVMELGNDEGFTVTLSNTANTYTGGTSILAGRLIIAGDGSLGAAPTESNSAFTSSLTIGGTGVPTNVLAAVQADNGIIFNSLTEGNGTLTVGTTTGGTFTTSRPIAVGSEAATIDVNDNTVTLQGQIITLGADGVGIGQTSGFSNLTIDDLSANGGKTTTAGKLILSTPSPYFYGDIIIGNTGTPTVEVMSDAALGNNTGPAAEIGEVELNGGTLQTGASFSASERNIVLDGGSQIDLDGNTTSWGTLTDVKRTIAIGNSSATAGAITFNNFTISQTSTLQLDGSANGTTYTGSETVTFTNGIAQTAATDALFINAATLGTTEKVFSSGASTTLVNGMAPAWMISDTGGGASTNPYSFLTYGANGYVALAFTDKGSGSSGGIRTAKSTDIVEQTGNATLSANAQAYALRVDDESSAVTITEGGFTITLGDGSDPAGLIMDGGGATITGGTLAFGGSEAMIYAKGTSTISSAITGSNGLTLAGSGTLNLGAAAPNLSGAITVDSGTLSLTAANVFATDIAGLLLDDVKSSPSNSILNFTANQTFTTLNSIGSKSAITFSNGAALTVGDTTNNLSSTISSAITETGTAVGGTSSGALNFDGSGLFDLSGMSSGTLSLASNSAIVVNNSAQLRVVASEFANANFGIVLNGAATQLQFVQNGGGQFANAVSGTGELHLIGGTLKITGTENTYSGGTVVEIGSALDLSTLNVSSGNANITDAGGLIVFDQNNNGADVSGTYAGVISDGQEMGAGPMMSGSLDIDDSAATNAAGANVTLTAVQTYTGATYIEAGTLTLNAANTIADSSGVTLGRVGGAVDGQTAGVILEANNELTSLSSDALNTTSVVLNGFVLTLDPTLFSSSDFGGTIIDGSAAGSLVVDGTGDAELTGANTFSGGTMLDSGMLELGANNSAGTGAITFDSASVTLRLDATLSTGTASFANALKDLAVGDQIDLAGLQFESGTTTTTFSGSQLTVTNGTATESFTLSNPATANFTVAADNTGGILLTAETAVAPTITGTIAGQTTTSEAAVTPFSGVTITDANNGGTDTDTLSITLLGGGTLADGVGFNGLSGSNGNYTLSGTAAAITAELDALSFKPADGIPNTSVTTTLTLSDKSSAFTTATVNSTTTVVDSDPAVAPTITGTIAGQTTTSEAAVTPFSGVTITDANNGGTDTDTLSITLLGGGTLADGVGFNGLSGSNGNYTLSGTAAAITAELDALSFKPADGIPNTSVTTTLTLSDKSSAFTTATVNSTTTVVDSDPAVAPTITGTIAGQTTTSETPVKPFSGVTIADANNGGTDTDTLSILITGGGTLSGTGLSGSNGNYTLSGTAAAITAELDALSFKPADGIPNTSVTTTLTLSDKSSAFAAATVNSTTTVIDSDPAAPPTITSVTPSLVKKGQTTVIGMVKPGIASATLSLKQTAGAGTLSLATVNGVQEIIYAAPANVPVGMLDTVSYTITDQYNDEAMGSNTVPVAPANDTIYVGTAGRTLNVGNGNSAIDGRTGNEAINAGNGNDIVFAGTNDKIILGNGNNVVLGGSNDTIQVGNGANDITTGANSLVIVGYDPDTFSFNFGSFPFGQNFDDPNAFASTITVGDDSTVFLANGQDTVTAGTNVNISGGNGRDTVTAGANANITLGDGNDTVNVSGGTGASITLGDGLDNVTATAGTASRIIVGDGNDTVTVSGGSGNAITVGDGNDAVNASGEAKEKITVGNGNDTVYAGANSTIAMGNGKDTVYAGTSDIITLGSGKDTVAFGVSPSPAAIGNETVNNFNTHADIIDFNHALFTNFAAVMADAKQVGQNTVITADATDTVTLHGVALSSLSASNFHFS